MILDALLIAIFSFVFCGILTDDGMIFGWYWRFLNAHIPEYLAKPLGTCQYCFAGQVALWYYLAMNISNYSLLAHIAFISGVIFIVQLIDKIING